MVNAAGLICSEVSPFLKCGRVRPARLRATRRAWRDTSFNEGEFFDVNLVPYGCEENPAEDLQYVAILFVEFELGERMFIEFVDRTNIVLPSELNVFANTIENLHDQILQELSKKNLVISRPDDANERQMKVPDRRIGNTSPDDLRDRLSAICWSPGESRLASSQIC